MNNFQKNLLALIIGSIVAIILLETILSIYNPFLTKQKFNDITLPVNRNYLFNGSWHPGLDDEIIFKTNSLGFRGPEIPVDSNNYLSIIAVGGSTTMCKFLSNKKDWPNLLNQKLSYDSKKIWTNNAGIDGHSTFGHQILLDNHIQFLQPNYIIYLIGVNEMARANAGHDLGLINEELLDLPWWRNLLRKSEAIRLAVNFFRQWFAQSTVGHWKGKFSDLGHINHSKEFINSELKKHEPYLEQYRERLTKLITSTRGYGIEPVLVTQPTIFGKGIDPVYGINLETINWHNLNGKTWWEILQKYNKVTLDVGNLTNTKTIDLAKFLPKNSLYFYDFVHFTNKGSEMVSEILAKELNLFLRSELESSND